MFDKKTWKDRVAEYPNRRLLVDQDTSAQSIVTVSRSEGNITEPGDAFSAANMNDLENRVYTETNNIEVDIANAQNGNTTTKSFPSGTYFIHNGILYKSLGINAGGAINPPNNCRQVAVMDELKSTNDSLASLTTQVNGLANTVSTKAQVVIVQADLSLDSSGRALYTINLSSYKPGTSQAYFPCVVNGISTEELYYASITDAHLSRYTVAIRRLTGSTSNPRVLISFFIN